MLAVAQKITNFYTPSPQRMLLLKKKIAEIGLKRQKLAAPSMTRWVQWIASLDEIDEAFEAIFKSLWYMKSNDRHTLSLTLQLQERMIDIVESLKHINLLKACLKDLHKSVDDIHDEYYNQALSWPVLLG